MNRSDPDSSERNGLLNGPRRLLGSAAAGAEAVPQLLQAASRMLDALTAVEALTARVDVLVGTIDSTHRYARQVVEMVEDTNEAAATVAVNAALTAGRVSALLDVYEPILQALAPALARIAEHLGPGEVDALIETINRAPALMRRVHGAVPVLDTLASVAPDLADLLESSRTLNEMLGSVPGLGRIKKRLDHDDEADDAHGDEDSRRQAS